MDKFSLVTTKMNKLASFLVNYFEATSYKPALLKIAQFHVITWCGNFVERHNFRIVLAYSPKVMRKLCISTKFPHQEII